MSTVPQRLAPGELRHPCLPDSLGFTSTDSLEPLVLPLGQERAVEAFDFGIQVDRRGFNLYAMGGERVGKRFTAEQLLQESLNHAAARKPSDWIYLHNFDDPRRPRAVELPAGMGRQFRDDMDQLVEDLVSAIPAAFESEEYHARSQQLRHDFAEEKQQPFEDLRQDAEEQGFMMVKTPGGISIAPMREGEVLDPEAFEQLPEPERQAMEAKLQQLEERLEGIVQRLPTWRRTFFRLLKELNREVTRNTAQVLIGEVRSRYPDQPRLLDFLDEVQEDVLEHSQIFQQLANRETPTPAVMPGLPSAPPSPEEDGDAFLRYRVNLFIDNASAGRAPIIHEENPSFSNLVGRIEHVSEMGALSTNFTLIRPGTLHRANGGYLILYARSVLMEPYAWEGLKRALHSGQITIESLGQAYGLVSTVSLEPEPIPLKTKVILIGDRLLYYLLCAHDPDFEKLFKVAADFEDDLERTPDNQIQFARLIASMIQREKLPAFDAGAIAALIEYAARRANHSGKLSLELDVLADIVAEAAHWALREHAAPVRASHVHATLEKRRQRHGRLRERLLEQVAEGTRLIDVQGRRAGQINGLSVLSFNDVLFGQPSRITARVRPGNAGIIDIERKVDLGGAIHSKGVLILSGFLGGHFLPRKPLSLSASIVFEQSYGGVDGDSASSTELYALLSALADLPLRQDLAVTGSVNQLGEVQAIGGANHKIEGFFETCLRKGELTGTQGVLIPESNVKHLMLRDEVVQACASGRFHVYPIRTIEEGIELLTGTPAGQRGPDGQFPPDSVFARVEARLEEFSDLLKKSGASGNDPKQEDEGERKRFRWKH